MSSETAVDFLIVPDDTMMALARDWNARLRQSVPGGFALDQNHTPHITLLQRYLRTDQLDAAFAAAAAAFAAVPATDLHLTAVKLAHMTVATAPRVGLAGLLIKAGPSVLALQSALLDALTPCIAATGTAAAYVTSDAEPDINADTLHYVENYVPEHSGPNYMAHVTVGEGTLEDLAALEAAPFEPVTFHPAGFAAYHLGNNGTAQTRLHEF